MFKQIANTSNLNHSPRFKACMRHRCLPNQSLSWFNLSYNSNRVLRISSQIFLVGFILIRLPNGRPKHPKSGISMSVASSINQPQSAPKSAISLPSNGHDGSIKVLKVELVLMTPRRRQILSSTEHEEHHDIQSVALT